MEGKTLHNITCCFRFKVLLWVSFCDCPNGPRAFHFVPIGNFQFLFLFVFLFNFDAKNNEKQSVHTDTQINK